MLLEPPFPGGAGGHQMTGGRGPSSTPHHHHKQYPTTTGGLSWAPWRGESARFLIVVRHTLPSPPLSFPSAPRKVWRHQAPERGVVLPCFGWGRGRERVGPGMPQGDGPAPIILAPTQG